MKHNAKCNNKAGEAVDNTGYTGYKPPPNPCKINKIDWVYIP